MKCKVNIKELKGAIKLHRLTIGKNLFILSGIKLDQEEGHIKIYSTNLEDCLSSKIKCEIYPSNTKKSIIVEYKTLKNIVDNNPEEFIDLEVLEEELIKDKTEVITPGHYDDIKHEYIADITETKKIKIVEYKLKVGKFELETMPEEEYPVLPEININSIKSTISFSEFIKVLTKMKDFPSRDSSRVILTTFHCNCSDNSIVSTDSYKLAKVFLDFNCEGIFNFSLECFNIIKNLKGEEVIINFDDNLIKFTIGDIIIITRNIQGKYPKYNQLIPDEFLHEFSFNSEAMIKRLNTILKVFKTDKNESDIPVTLTFFNKEVTIAASFKTIGNYKDSIACNITPGLMEPIVMAFTPLYLIQCLDQFEEAIIHFNESLKPVVIKENNNELYLLMPIRIN